MPYRVFSRHCFLEELDGFLFRGIVRQCLPDFNAEWSSHHLHRAFHSVGEQPDGHTINMTNLPKKRKALKDQRCHAPSNSGSRRPVNVSTLGRTSLSKSA